MLEYRRSQNSGYPLQGRVFVGTADVDVDVDVDVLVALAVALPVRVVTPCPPTSSVTESDLVDTVFVLLPVSVLLASSVVVANVTVEEIEG